MNRIFRPLLVVFAVMLMLPALLRADVHDNAAIFSQGAVDRANADMQSMHQRHNKDLVIETFAAVPDDQKAKLASDGKDAFFRSWMDKRLEAVQTNGVYVLICMDPKHVEVGAGKNTRAHGDFSESDITRLREQLQKSLGAKQYDDALSNAVADVERAYTANIIGQSTPPMRASQPPVYNSNTGYTPTYTTSNHSSGVGTMASLICLAVGVIIIISIIRSVFRGNSGGGYGGGNYGGGNYGGNYPPPQGGYGPGPGYGGGGGSGFGRGFLGGLLGGAVGSYAENRFEGRNDSSNTPTSQPGWGDSSGANSGGGNSSFDSGPSDAGQGFDSGSSGGDFGGGSSGDSGGGGGSSGGDF